MPCGFPFGHVSNLGEETFFQSIADCLSGSSRLSAPHCEQTLRAVAAMANLAAASVAVAENLLSRSTCWHGKAAYIQCRCCCQAEWDMCMVWASLEFTGRWSLCKCSHSN